MQRTIFFGAIAIVLIGVGVALYLLFSSGTRSLTTAPNPFDGTGADGIALEGEEGEDETFFLGGAGETLAPRFIKITSGPVAVGSVVFGTSVVDEQEGGATTSSLQIPEKEYEVRYIDRASGNVYSYLVLKQTSTRISNRTVPGVAEASWLPDGSLAYVRYSSDGTLVETYALPAEESEGFLLEENLSQVAVHSGDRVMTVLPSSSGTLVSMVGRDGKALGTSFSLPLSQVRIGFLGERFLATTRGSSLLDGYAFSVSTGGSLTRLLGPLRGLSTLTSPSGAYVLYSYVSKGALQTAILNVETGEKIPLPVGTLAEKCAWQADETRILCAAPRALSGTLPDAWYQGAVSFSDRIWSIDLEERLAVQLVDPEAFGEPVDVVGLSLPEDAQVLVFTDKKSGALYLYDL